MALKYDFNLTSIDSGNIFVDGLAYANNQTSGLMVYAMVLTLTFITMYVYIKSTDDISLTLVRSLFFGTVISMIFYYMGLSVGVSLFSGSVLLSMILIVAASGGMLYYSRNKVGGE